MVRPLRAAPHPGAGTGGDAGHRGQRSAARTHLRRSRRAHANARLRGGHPRTAGALCHFRLPDSERVRGAREVVGGIRRGHPGGVDKSGRRRAGGEGWRVLRAGRRSGRIRRPRHRFAARPRACRRHGGACPRRSGSPVGHGRPHRAPGGKLSRPGEGETNLKGYGCCGADPPVRAGRPRPASVTTVSASWEAQEADGGVGRGPGGPPHRVQITQGLVHQSGADAFVCQLPYFTFGFRSFLMRLTMSLAVRSISFGVPPLAGWYTDQTTWRDLASTRKTVPLARPNDEFDSGLDSLFTVSPSSGLGSSSVLAGFSPLAVFSVLAGFGGGAGLSVSGGGNISSSFAWKPSPIWSVNTASASFGSVTIWKTWSEVRRFARNWSSPLAILSRYTLCTLARSAAHSMAAEQEKRNASRFIEPIFIQPMIS